ncbi:MAG: hypothetical protein SFY96_02180 [Planctomycetota bacterium]|nr:hypothetical protein [Planctomycetota bacterium]
MHRFAIRVRRLVGCAIVLCTMADAARAAVVTWTGLGTGSNAGLWSSPLNWSSNPSLPGVNDDVVIPSGFTGITLNAGVQSVRSVTVNAPITLVFDTLSVSSASVFNAGVTINGATLTGAGDITVNADTTWLKGKLQGTGKLIVAAGKTFTINPGANACTLSRPIEVRGTLKFLSGQLAFSGGSIVNRSGGVIRYEGATQAWLAGGSGNDVTNDPGATILKIDSGTYQFSGGVRLMNNGLVTIQAGTLDMASANAQTSGTFDVWTNATLRVSANHELLSGATITGSGLTRFTAATTTVSGSASVSNPIFTQTLTGAGDLTITGQLGEWQQGVFSGAGKTIIAAGANFAIKSASHTLVRTLENRGTMTWSVGAIGMGSGGVGGTINNVSGGQFNISAAEQCIGASGVSAINNSGTITKTSAATTPLVLNGGALTFNNNGLVQVQGGTLKLDLGGSHSGNFNISTGATLSMGATHTFTSTGQVSGAGTWLLPSAPVANATFAGVVSFGGTVDMRSGTLAFNNSAFLTNLTHSGGTLTGSGQIAISGNASWTAGAIDGTGLLLVSSGGSLSIAGTTGLTLKRNFENQGLTTWSAANISVSPPTGQPASTVVTLTNKSTGNFVCATGAANLSIFAVGGSQATFTNLQGVVRKTGSGSVSFDRDASPSLCAFNNTLGTVYVDQGAFNIKNGGSSSGTFVLAAGTTLNLAPVSGLATGYTFTNGSEVSGAGKLVLPSGSPIALAGAVKWGNTDLSGQTISGTGDLSISGVSNWTAGSLNAAGELTILPGATLNVYGSSHTLAQHLINRGTINWTGGPIAINNAELLNDVGGVFNMTLADSIIGAGGTPVLRNLGTIVKSGAGTVALANSSSSITLDNPGRIEVLQGVLSLPSAIAQKTNYTLSAGTWVVGDGAELEIPAFQLRTLGGFVEMRGPGSTFAPLRFLSIINGGLTLTDGRSFKATPNGGELINNGSITIRPGSELTIIGSYSQLPGALFESVWGYPAANAGSLTGDVAGQIRIIGFGLVNLDGTFHGVIQPGLSTQCSDSRPAISGPYIFGGFSSLGVSGTAPGRFFTIDTTRPTSIRLVASTLADFNRDGFIDFSDFDDFVLAFEAGDPISDVNADGFLDFTDFDDFIALFESGC